MKLILSIVIPCLNEKQTIKQVIADAKENAKKSFPGTHEIIIADNGSTDGTLEILKSQKGVRVINVPVRGYGAALHWGVLSARAPFVIFGDADLSYPFSNLSRFKPLLKRNPDLILGSRLRGTIEKNAMPLLHRYLGTPVLTWLIRLLYRIPTTDCNSGMRVVKVSFYHQLNMRNSGMEWASELLLKTALKKGKYLETPIKFLKDKRHRPPHLSTWSDGWRHLKAILLLKPSSLILISAFFSLISIPSLSFSYSIACFFLLLATVFILSYLALRFLEFAIEKRPNHISILLNSNMLVPWVMMITVSIAGIVILLPDVRLGSKLMLISVNNLLFIWVFLIETIKTHLVNRLPNLS